MVVLHSGALLVDHKKLEKLAMVKRKKDKARSDSIYGFVRVHVPHPTIRREAVLTAGLCPGTGGGLFKCSPPPPRSQRAPDTQNVPVGRSSVSPTQKWLALLVSRVLCLDAHCPMCPCYGPAPPSVAGCCPS